MGRKARAVWSVGIAAPRAGESLVWRLHASPPKELAAGGRPRPKTDPEVPFKGWEDVAGVAAARAQAATWQAQLNAELQVEGELTVAQLLERDQAWREANVGKKGCAKGTLKAFRTQNDKLVPLVGDVLLSKITKGLIKLKVQDELSKAGLANTSINLAVARLQAAWAWASERELVTGDWPRVKCLPKEPVAERPFTVDEVNQVLDWIVENAASYSAVFEVVAQTGCRIGEVITLQGKNVTLVEGKGAVLQIEAGKAKTKKERHVGVTWRVAQLLPAADRDEYLFRPSRTQWMGTSLIGTHLSARTVLGVLHRALDACGLPRTGELDTHSFRRSRITDGYDAGLSRHVNMKNAGHSNSANHDRYTQNAGWDPIAASETVESYRRPSTGSSTASTGYRESGRAKAGGDKAPAEGPAGARFTQTVAQVLATFQFQPAGSPQVADPKGCHGLPTAVAERWRSWAAEDPAAWALLAGLTPTS